MSTIRVFSKYTALVLFVVDVIFSIFVLITDTSGWGGLAVFAINIFVLPIIAVLFMFSKISGYLDHREVKFGVDSRGLLTHRLPLQILIGELFVFTAYFIYYQFLDVVSTDLQEALFTLGYLSIFLSLFVVMFYYLGLYIYDSNKNKPNQYLYPSE